MANIGDVFCAKYQVRQFLGKGGTSRVYLAWDLRLHKEWVLKEIPKSVEGRDNLPSVCAALQEAHRIKSLDHPAIVRIVDVWEEEASVYIVEDYVRGMPLHEAAVNGRLKDEAQLVDIAIQLCGILQYLHSRKPPVIYRDLKPANVILSEQGFLRIVDFGAARLYKPEKTQDTVPLGTESFAAPEQYGGFRGQTDARTDIYGLGKTLLWLCRYCGDISPAFQSILEICTRQQPQRRYPDAAAVLRDLKALSSKLSAKKKKKIRNRKLRILLLLPAAALVLCVVFAVLPKIPEEEDLTAKLAADGIFTSEEEFWLLQNLPKEPREALAFSVGRLYWYCYETTQDRNAGKKQAVFWFEQAGHADALSEAYAAAGKILQMTDDPGNAEEPADVWRNGFQGLLTLLEENREEAKTPASSFRMLWEDSRLALELMELYARKFRDAGVSMEQMLRLYSLAFQNIRSEVPETPEEQQEKENLLAGAEDFLQLLNRVFGMEKRRIE